MYLLQNDYKFFKFFSISSVINEEKNRYYDAIENTIKKNSKCPMKLLEPIY